MHDMLATELFFGLLFVAAGGVLFTGARKRWAWLVDPPTEFWFCYSQSLLKAVFGTEGCRAITQTMGVLFVVVGSFLLVRSWV